MWALIFMHFPGLSCSGSGSWVLYKGADLVGPVFCTHPRSEQLICVYNGRAFSGVPCVSSGDHLESQEVLLESSEVCLKFGR